MSEEFTKESIIKSEQIVGQLREVLVNQEGKVLDGNHRLLANPEWGKKVVETKSRVEEILVRLHAHHRRRVSQEETRDLVVELAHELQACMEKDKVASELVRILPYSEGYIRRLLPLDFKQADKVKAGKISADISEQKREEVKRTVCEVCGVAAIHVEQWHGHNLCLLCVKKADLHREKFLGKFRKPIISTNREKPPPPTYKETWEHRKATMSPETSKMETELLEMWREAGYGPVRVHHEWILESLFDDWWSVRYPSLVFFVDGEEAHKGKEDYDAERRSRLEKKYGVNIIPLPYRTFTHKAKMELWKKIQEAVEPLKEASNAASS